MLLLFAAAFVGLVFFAVLSERKRIETLAAVELPPAIVRHNQLAEAIKGVEAGGREIPPDLAFAADSVARWTALFHRLEQEVDGPEWDEVTDLWYAAKRWEALSPDGRTTILAFLDARADFIMALRECAALGGPVRAYILPLPLDMGDKPGHLAPLDDCAYLLCIDAVARAHTGGADRALDDCVAAIQLSEAVASEPWWPAQAFRRRYSYRACRVIQEAIAPGDITGAAAARLIQAARATAGRGTLVLELEVYQLGANGKHLALLDKGWGERYTDMWRFFSIADNGIAMRGTLLAYASPVGRPWLNRDIAQTSEILSRAIDVAHLPYYEAVARYDDTVHGFSPYARITETFPISLMQSQADYEVQRQLLQIGLTLEQYQLAHGAPPASLDTIASEFPEATLIDPFTGERLVYRPGDSDFLLYSVGRNQTDDGGKHDVSHGDIVWRGTQSE